MLLLCHENCSNYFVTSKQNPFVALNPVQYRTVVCYHMVQLGTVQQGTLPYGQAWYSTVGCVTVWSSLVQHSRLLPYDPAWYSGVCYCMVLLGTVQQGMLPYSPVQFNPVRYVTSSLFMTKHYDSLCEDWQLWADCFLCLKTGRFFSYCRLHLNKPHLHDYCLFIHKLSQ